MGAEAPLDTVLTYIVYKIFLALKGDLPKDHVAGVDRTPPHWVQHRVHKGLLWEGRGPEAPRSRNPRLWPEAE